MLSIGLILAVMALLALWLWLVQAWRELTFFRAQLAGTWQQLQSELAARREMIPYLVTAAPAAAASLGAVIGNACDMAANIEGVRECSQAEARLGAALGRLVALLDEPPGTAGSTNLGQMRARLRELDERVALLREAHNRQADTFNTLLDRPAGRLLVRGQLLRKVERF